MISGALLHEMYENTVNSSIAIIVLAFVYLSIILLFSKKIESQRKRRQFRVRTTYIIMLVLLFIMARIWVEGFTHLLAVLGLVSAALVVTNKETIMNIVGSLIIRWRSLFSERDLIQVQQYKGYVKSVGMLYFTLEEVSDHTNTLISGRVIKIPNGLIANNTLINYSQTVHLQLQQLTLTITRDSDIEKSCTLLKKVIDDILYQHIYKEKREYTKNYLQSRHQGLAKTIADGTTVIIKPRFDKPNGVDLTAFYYCFELDHSVIEQLIWRAILIQFKEHTQCTLAYVS